MVAISESVLVYWRWLAEMLKILFWGLTFSPVFLLFCRAVTDPASWVSSRYAWVRTSGYSSLSWSRTRWIPMAQGPLGGGLLVLHLPMSRRESRSKVWPMNHGAGSSQATTSKRLGIIPV